MRDGLEQTKMYVFFHCTLWILCVGIMFPQETKAQIKLDATIRSTIVETLAEKLNDNYVFPDVGKEMGDDILERLEKGEFDNINVASTFAYTLTSHLREISHDKHLEVFFSYEPLPEDGQEPSQEEIKQWEEQMRLEKYGFYKVEKLAGNIGYLGFRYFGPPNMAAKAVTEHMSFLADSNALIIDMRLNGGGDPEMVAFISSYLFDEATHLNDIYWRTEDFTQQFWTQSFVPGERFGGTKPIYVLTSSGTFSAAEEFTYNLQNLKRATIIGEVTGGGAHPTNGFRLTENFGVGIPVARAINPISKTNWEGVGVQPDIAMTAGETLKAAHKLALETVLTGLDKETDAALFEEIKQALVEFEGSE